ncbi:sensor histidine kinase [[Clostridium] symbiosum]|uniref:sensor histidine kinase n=1 Tax=Clostridium symbiosum TaxID=1512 RepID=UPI00189B9592|nr:HAMP domain-containing sensor histidine kinase [[Clostridium] symbiosum]
MRVYGKYISKFLISFIVVILFLLVSNIIVFFWMFHHVVSTDYGESSPRSMVEKVAGVSTSEGLPLETKEELHRNHIWAMFLSSNGECLWQVDLPEEIPTNYTVQDVALFSKGYLNDYPVFVWADDTGLLVLGYPQNSYIKIIGNYYSANMLEVIPLFVVFIGAFDLTIIFLIYFLSKQKIIKNTEPIISSVEALSSGTPVKLSIKGELSSVADSVNRASKIITQQNQARANWISGVSHDIRTPLSMIMGYAARIAENKTASEDIQKQAEIVRSQSVKIKELVQDLNLVSQLEYEMQPLHKEVVRLSKLLRSYVADLLNTGISNSYNIGIEIAPDAENAVLECDARLITRAVNNLVQNSISHNPQGCHIQLILTCYGEDVFLTVSDNGIGLSPEKYKELTEKPHYLKSTDERLDLRHGLGLILVRQIVEVHGGKMEIKDKFESGFEVTISFISAQTE